MSKFKMQHIKAYTHVYRIKEDDTLTSATHSAVREATETVRAHDHAPGVIRRVWIRHDCHPVCEVTMEVHKAFTIKRVRRQKRRVAA